MATKEIKTSVAKDRLMSLAECYVAYVATSCTLNCGLSGKEGATDSTTSTTSSSGTDSAADSQGMLSFCKANELKSRPFKQNDKVIGKNLHIYSVLIPNPPDPTPDPENYHYRQDGISLDGSPWLDLTKHREYDPSFIKSPYYEQSATALRSALAGSTKYARAINTSSHAFTGTVATAIATQLSHSLVVLSVDTLAEFTTYVTTNQATLQPLLTGNYLLEFSLGAPESLAASVTFDSLYSAISSALMSLTTYSPTTAIALVTPLEANPLLKLVYSTLATDLSLYYYSSDAPLVAVKSTSDFVNNEYARQVRAYYWFISEVVAKQTLASVQIVLDTNSITANKLLVGLDVGVIQ